MIIHADHRQAWVIKLTLWHYLVKTLFQSFMAYDAKTDYVLCVYELVYKVGIYFIEVSKRIICVRL